MKHLIFFTLIFMTLSCSNKTEREEFHNSEGDWIVNRKGQIELYTRKSDFKSISSSNYEKIQMQLNESNIDLSSLSSPNDESIIKILENQNKYINQINQFLKTSFNDTVKIFLYNLEESFNSKKNIKWADSKNNTIYYVFYNFIHDIDGKISHFIGPHEMVHIITSNSIGRAKTRLFGEGYAVAITKNYSSEIIGDKYVIKSLDMWHESILKSSTFLSPTDLLKNEFIPESEFYPQAGLFITWLFQNYDIELVNQLYLLESQNIFNEFKNITGDSFNEMEEKYLEQLNRGI